MFSVLQEVFFFFSCTSLRHSWIFSCIPCFGARLHEVCDVTLSTDNVSYVTAWRLTSPYVYKKSRYEMFLHFIRTSTTNVGSPCPSFARKPFLSSFSCWLRWMSRWLTGVSFLLRENLQRFRPWSVISWPFAEGCTRMYIHSYEECRHRCEQEADEWWIYLQIKIRL